MTTFTKAVTGVLGIALVVVLTLPDRKTVQVADAGTRFVDTVLGRAMGTRKG